jgi:hypothetical protein
LIKYEAKVIVTVDKRRTKTIVPETSLDPLNISSYYIQIRPNPYERLKILQNED